MHPLLAKILAVALFFAAAVPCAAAAERIYYIAADVVVWDYAPSYPNNPITAAPFTKEESVSLRDASDRIGRRYFKAVYHEYTDASFATLKPRGPDEQSLGILGPIIRAEVGDTITVVFQNNTAIPVGIHPHGVFYDKASEGAHYAIDDSAAPRERGHGMEAYRHEMVHGHAMAEHGGASVPETGAHVPPLGGRYVYHWQVPERAGPGPADPDSIVWLYHAHDHENVDIYAGLVGAIIVTRAGRARPDGTPKDVDREFVMLFMIFDENLSPYLDQNIREFAGEPINTRDEDSNERSETVNRKDGGFAEANRKYAINGLLYGNLGGLTMRRGENVRWYVIGLGNEIDVHTPHWHGNTVLRHGSRVDTVEVFPATTQVVDMRPDNVGTWLFHCHVAEHMAGGMMTRYTVTEK